MRILEFWAPWCGPCKISKAAIASLRSSRNVNIEEVNADENQELVAKYGIKSLPTMIVLDDQGEVVNRHAGAMSTVQMIDFLSASNMRF